MVQYLDAPVQVREQAQVIDVHSIEEAKACDSVAIYSGISTLIRMHVFFSPLKLVSTHLHKGTPFGPRVNKPR